MDCFPEETITSMPCYLLLFHFSIQNYTHLFAIHSMFVLSHLFPVSHIECEFAPERGVPEIGLFRLKTVIVKYVMIEPSE